jgi:transcriptional regulator with XRE-family HTH domain
VSGPRTRRSDSNAPAPPAKPVAVPEGEALQLGAQIRTLRARAGLTLQALAGNIGVSASLISQVERGIASPSITTLRHIAAALDVPVAALFIDTGASADRETDRFGRTIVVRASARKHLHVPRSQIVYELLTPDLNRQIEFLWIEYAPGATAHPSPMSHPGEENAVCLEGSVVVTIEDEGFVLGEGDSISFDSGRLHQVENQTTERAVLISAITPPAF